MPVRGRLRSRAGCTVATAPPSAGFRGGGLAGRARGAGTLFFSSLCGFPFKHIFFKQVLGYAPPIREAACAISLEEFRGRSLCVRFSFPSLFDFLDWTVFITGSDKVWTRVPHSLHQPLVDAARKLPCLSVRLCCAVLLISGFCSASLNLARCRQLR